ncbi:uncharacterized protein TEOVI_000261600 [Trypanosoma equiperdum]|uniref:Uncharacterized protein n=1 Tax=Trypanosoma equiperdum TaxID=5694 RepID=A0A1G4IFD9_TRYEQ|nr:hypothetical protein, conserved [Trypanosoma equiperdum]
MTCHKRYISFHTEESTSMSCTARKQEDMRHPAQRLRVVNRTTSFAAFTFALRLPHKFYRSFTTSPRRSEEHLHVISIFSNVKGVSSSSSDFWKKTVLGFPPRIPYSTGNSCVFPTHRYAFSDFQERIVP